MKIGLKEQRYSDIGLKQLKTATLKSETFLKEQNWDWYLEGLLTTNTEGVHTWVLYPKEDGVKWEG